MSIEFISQSSLGQFLRCPVQWERRWVYNEILPPGIAARRGSSVHHAAEINHAQKVTSMVDLPVDELMDAARDEFVRLIKERGVFIPKDQVGEKNRLLAEGLDGSVRLTKLYRAELAPTIQPAIVEKRIYMDVGLGVPLAGTIDVLDINHALIDMKTAAKSKAQGDADKSLQLSFYSGLVADDTGKWPTDISLNVLVDLKEPKMQVLHTKRGPDDFQKLMGRIQFMLAQVEAGLFPPCPPDSWICSPVWCGWWSSCKWGGQR